MLSSTNYKFLSKDGDEKEVWSDDNKPLLYNSSFTLSDIPNKYITGIGTTKSIIFRASGLTFLDLFEVDSGSTAATQLLDFAKAFNPNAVVDGILSAVYPSNTSPSFDICVTLPARLTVFSVSSSTYTIRAYGPSPFNFTTSSASNITANITEYHSDEITIDPVN